MPADPDDTHRGWIRRAIRLAMNGRGRVEPNPMVGCVIVGPAGGPPPAEGYHRQFGGPHAEADALAACAAAGSSAGGATVYTTLEPCCHTNKKTPPCVPRLIGARVGRVVVGCVDPDPAVDGRGVRLLREAGVDVVVGVLGAECRQLLAPFVARVVHRRPYVTLKWAETADGKVAAAGGKPLRISNAESTRRVHQLRGRCDAVLVGLRTAVNDDPLLTARGVGPGRDATRVVLDRDLELPPGGRLVSTAAAHPLAVYCSEAALALKPAAVAALRAAGATVTALPLDDRGLSLSELLADLGRRNVTHLLVEPGPTLASSFLRAGLADRVWVFRSPLPLRDAAAPDALAVPYPAAGVADLAGDTLTEYLNPGSPVFFAAEPSADFVLATTPDA